MSGGGDHRTEPVDRRAGGVLTLSPNRGGDLARHFHADIVGPLLAAEVPRLRYAAARLGSGSDVLGLDDATSRDHDWGLRLTVLVDAADAAVVPVVDDLLTRHLPERYRELPVRFPTSWHPAVNHRVGVSTVGDFAASRLGLDPLAGLSTLDWLVLTGQSVLEIVAGPVFVDATRELRRLRDTLRWYPPDLERYVLAAGWQRVVEYLPIMGRTAERGDELGSRLLAGALATDLIRLAFLLHRRWPPYPKWLGTVLATLPAHARLAGPLRTAVRAATWRAREMALRDAAEVLLDVQRAYGLPTPGAGVIPFHDRPYRTVNPAVPAALLADVIDPEVNRLPPRVGSIEQWVDNVSVLTDPARRAAIVALYRAWLLDPE